jgi:hypothetical protein
MMVFSTQLSPLLVMLVSTLLCLLSVDAFALPAFHRPAVAVTPKSRLFAEQESLTFQATFTATSDQIGTENKDELRAFFMSKTCRDHFFSAGGSRKISDEPLTPELEQHWNDACTAHYGAASRPEKGDVVVATESDVQFPGLTMKNKVYNGMKLLENGDFPTYTILLIAEKKRVFGARPVVWLFNQLTGNDAEKEDTFSAPSGMAQSKIYVVEEESGYFINFDCEIEITVKFPKWVVKILPVSKEKMEEQGSASVKKAVGNDISKCVESANDAFLNWQKAESKAAASS